MSTVGYGGRYPTTTLGRLVAVGLMVSGIALLGTVTATLASCLSDRVNRRTASCRARAVAGALPPSSRAVTHPRRLDRSSGAVPCSAHHVRQNRTPSC